MNYCSGCGQPLTEGNFHKHYLSVCNNWQCPLYKERQGIRAKVITQELLPEKKTSPSDQIWLVERKAQRGARYRLARSLGIDSIRASNLRDQTTVDIEKLTKADKVKLKK